MDPANEDSINITGNDVWHSFIFTCTGDYEIGGMAIDLQPAGEV